MEDNNLNENINVISYPEPIENEDCIEKENIDTTVNLMNKPFDPTKINIETKIFSLYTLIKRIENKTIQLNTEAYFQRKEDLWELWEQTEQSRLIESILIQFPLPAFFFDATNDSNWLVIEGLQILSSIENFSVTKTLKLTNLEYLIKLNGFGWDDIGADLQRLLQETQIVVYKIMPGTPTDIKFNIFKRINTGGLVLEPQEIRHALFQGKPAEFIAELASTKEFIDATNKKIKSHRMLDRDFANRFLCFYLLGYENYSPDLDTYMSEAMASIYSKTDIELDKIRYDFKESMKLSKEIFGNEAFCKVYTYEKKIPPVNKALFDAISVQFAKLSQNERSELKNKGMLLKNELIEELSTNIKFFNSVTSSTGDKKKVLERHEVIKELIHKIITLQND